MQKIKRYKTYSFPFLAEYTTDYKKTQFLLDAKHLSKEGYIHLMISYTISNDEINQLIKNNKLKVVAKVVCSSMGFNKTVEFDKDANTKEVQYDSMTLDGDVSITAYLVSVEDINYNNLDLSSDWMETTVRILAHNIIGESDERIITVKHVKSGTRKSIFKFTKDVNLLEGDPFKISLAEDDAIIFILPDGDWTRFYSLRNKNVESIVTLYIIPVLTDILRRMIDPIRFDDEGCMLDEAEFTAKHQSKTWYRVIEDNYRKVFEGKEAREGNIEPIEAAQTIVSKYAIHNILGFCSRNS